MSQETEITKNLLEQRYYLGVISGWMSVFIAYWLYYGWMLFGSSSSENRKKKLLDNLQNLIIENQGVVTIADLMFKSEVSFNKTQKFLKELTHDLGIEAEVDEETGMVFYYFGSAKEIAERRKPRHILATDGCLPTKQG